MERVQIGEDTEIAVVLVFDTGRYHAKFMNVDDAIASELRTIARDSLAGLESRRSRDYDPDAEQLDGEYVVIPDGVLFDADLLEQIRPGAACQLLEDEYLLRHLRKAFCYALVFGPDDDSRTIFIRKVNPIQLNTKPLVGTRINGVVRKLDAPVFAFDTKIDVIITKDQFIAVSQGGFNQLFRNDEFIIRQVHGWLQSVFHPGRLPLSPEGMTHLQNRTKKNSTLRRKIESVLRQPYMNNFTMNDLRAALDKAEWNHDRFIANECIVVDERNELELLHLLNDDPYVGSISGAKLMSTSKRTRT